MYASMVCSALARSLPLKIAALALLSGAVLHPTAALALCLSGDAGTNCASFNPSSSSAAETFGYADSNLATNQFFKLSLSYAGANPVTVSSVAYSLNNGTNWTAYNNGTLGSGTNGSFGPAGAEVSSGTPFGTNQLRFRLTIPAGLPSNTATAPANNSMLTFKLEAGDSTGPTGNITTATRTLAPSPAAPGPVPLLGAAVALRYSRKLRSRIRSLGRG